MAEADQDATRARGRVEAPTAWLLPNGAGQPLELRRVRRIFRATLRAAGLPRFRLYDLRHTYATLRLLDGAPPLYVAAQLGHRDVITTLRHYARWIPSADRRWVEDDVVAVGKVVVRMEPGDGIKPSASALRARRSIG